MRDVMRLSDKEAMREHPDVFYVTGNIAWTVRAPYWHVALASDAEGNRFLSDDNLDRALPKWKLILNGERIPTQRYPMAAEFFSEWLAVERQKAYHFGKPWPRTSSAVVRTTSVSKTVTSDVKSSTFVSRLRSGGRARLSSFEVEDPHEVEQTRLLREILTELKETKQLVEDAIRGNTVQPMTQFAQVTDIARSSTLHGVPQGAQGFYQGLQQYPEEVQHLCQTSDADYQVVPELTQQNRVNTPQYLTPAVDTPAVDEKWQCWGDHESIPDHHMQNM
jgi:hypothetical protein